MVIIQDAVISFIEKIKSATRLHKLIAFAAVAVVLMFVSYVASGVRVTYNVHVDGKAVANVASHSVYEEGVKAAGKLLNGDKDSIGNTELKAVITVNAKSASAKEVGALILKNAASVCDGYKVTIGEDITLFVEDKAEVEAAIQNRLNAFNVEGAECESKFTAQVGVEQAYFSLKALSDSKLATDTISTLDVVTTAVKKTAYTVPYETVTTRTSSQLAGYIKVTKSGVRGKNEKVEEITYLNGAVTATNKLSDVVVSSPVNEVIVIGTGKASYNSAYQNASTAGFKWPLTVKGTITSYWGDGRGHKGVDLAVPVGTKVLAVKGGTVVEARYTSDYGYHVTIDHGNGVKTRYAHNKYNTVSVGQTVSAGQVIAISGNSGRSSGPHLHFEVIINGTRVNPAPYIGL
ncbi:MAG: peptidoglycan DD-metalloendopeptidase family protein [Clostridia bacterium]|nr:peptidoglycan DD-metalloendopeptidase family protein [Clostridia bacterium]